jgi:hypothetical protein
LGTSISVPLLLGDLLGVDLLGSVRQGCSKFSSKVPVVIQQKNHPDVIMTSQISRMWRESYLSTHLFIKHR